MAKAREVDGVVARVVEQIDNAKVLRVRHPQRGHLEIELGHCCWHARRAMRGGVEDEEDAAREGLEEEWLGGSGRGGGG